MLWTGRRKRRGFTIVELMVSTVVLAILLDALIIGSSALALSWIARWLGL